MKPVDEAALATSSQTAAENNNSAFAWQTGAVALNRMSPPSDPAASASAAPLNTTTYVNPVLDEDFPDPAVIHAPDGHYYAYATQSLRNGEWINIQVARSSDLVHWEHLGDALPEKPSWASRTQDFWAPYVLHDGERYLMFYAASPDDCSNPPCHWLAVAAADSP